MAASITITNSKSSLQEIEHDEPEFDSFIDQIPGDVFSRGVLPFLHHQRELPFISLICNSAKIEMTKDIRDQVRRIQLETAQKVTLRELQEYERVFKKPLVSDNVIFLDLSNSDINNGQLAKYCSQFSKLSTLSLRRCDEITALVVNTLRNFCYLDLGFCHAVSDDVVPSILINNPGLQHFDLSGCEITDASLTAIADASLALRGASRSRFISLSFHFCGDITDVGIRRIARCCSDLEYLNLGFCDKLSDSSVREFAKNCLKIRVLNIEGCNNLTDTAVKAIARHLKRLENLVLKHCINITSSSMRTINAFCLRMKKLDIKFCSQISVASTLGLTLRNCQVIRS